MSFFNELKNGVGQGVSAISEGSKTLMAKAKLNSDISGIQANRKKWIEYVGAMCYQKYAAGLVSDGDLSEGCEKISELDAQIASLQKELEVLSGDLNPAPIEGGIPCTCGFINQPDSKFCMKCGKELG